jgi:tetratricopeptide (TPR) repeat protein
MALDRAKPDRQKMMEAADKLVAGGQVIKAIQEYRLMLREFPGDMTLMNRLGDLCVQANRLDEAAATFKVLALNLQKDREDKKAIALLKKVLRFAPGDLEAAHQLVELLHATGQPKEAAQIHFQLARHLEKYGDPARALEQFAAGVEADSGNPEMKVQLAQRYAESGQKEKAAGQFLEAAEAMALAKRAQDAESLLDRAAHLTDGPRLTLARARVAVLNGEAAKAVDILEDALLHYPGNPVLLEAMADVQLQAGYPDKCLGALLQVRQPNPRCLSFCEQAMADLVQKGQGRLALRLFRPLALALARKGNATAVMAALKTAFKGRPHPVRWILESEVAMEGDMKDEALFALRQAYTMLQNRKSAILRNIVHGRIEDLEGSKKSTQQIVLEQAGGATMMVPILNARIDAHQRIQLEQMEKDAYAQAKLGNHTGAGALFEQILAQEPGRMSAILGMISTHLAAGNLAKVQMQCIQGAQALVMLGRRQEARQLLDTAELHVPGSTKAHRHALGL